LFLLSRRRSEEAEKRGSKDERLLRCRAAIESESKVLPRPTCMALPAALSYGMVTSTGCIGNRVYTDIDDGELYLVISGKDVARVADQAQTIGSANAQLLEYHRQRRQTLETA